MKIVAIITVRDKSERLPLKALADIAGKPLLLRLIERARQAEDLDLIVVSTTFDSPNIIKFCEEHSIPYSLAPSGDIVNALYQAARDFGADVIVRLWGDCPLMNAAHIDWTIQRFQASEHKQDGYFVSRQNLTGYYVTVLSMQLLEKTWEEISDLEERKWYHLYMVDKNPYVDWVIWDDKNRLMNLTVDTQEDLDKVRRIYEAGQENNY